MPARVATTRKMATLLAGVVRQSGLTQKAFAAAVGTSEKHLSRVLSGQCAADPATLDEWVAAFGRTFTVKLSGPPIEPTGATMTTGDLDNRFSYHAPATVERRQAHDTVRGGCLALAQTLDGLLPEGREKSLAITNLEQVMFWGNAALARTPDEG